VPGFTGVAKAGSQKRHPELEMQNILQAVIGRLGLGDMVKATLGMFSSASVSCLGERHSVRRLAARLTVLQLNTEVPTARFPL